MARWRTGLFAALLVCGAVSGGHASRPGLPSSEGAVAVSDASPSRPTRASQARRIVASGELPLVFERNDGQLDPAGRTAMAARSLSFSGRPTCLTIAMSLPQSVARRVSPPWRVTRGRNCTRTACLEKSSSVARVDQT